MVLARAAAPSAPSDAEGPASNTSAAKRGPRQVSMTVSPETLVPETLVPETAPARIGVRARPAWIA